MKTTARLAALLLALASLAAVADDDKPWPVDLVVGGTFEICANGSIICPATTPICDNTSIATLRDGKNGLEILAVTPGTTLCSAASSNKLRRVYRVTVTPPLPKDGGTP
jgi:hypothetical protein